LQSPAPSVLPYTTLFRSSHVVEGVWDKGIREVFLERRDQRFPATIIKVDKTEDVALLQAKEKFPRLETTTDRVKSGEQIAVVGSDRKSTRLNSSHVKSSY